MDISEIWSNGGYLLAPAAALFLLFMAFRIPTKWIRISAVCICFLFVAVAGLALFLDGYFLIYSTARRPGLVSPDGRHVALVRWDLVGAVGEDHVHVSIRSRFSPIATEVESDLSNNTPYDPEVRWLDNRRLLISYWENGQIGECSSGRNRVKGIEVLCQQ